jgi:hypothetical protein
VMPRMELQPAMATPPSASSATIRITTSRPSARPMVLQRPEPWRRRSHSAP